MNWERWARAAGIGFFLFTVAAFIVGGEPPKVSDSPEDVAAYFTENRSQVLVSSFLFAVGLILFLWFAGAVANTLRERGEGRVAATALAAGTTWAASPGAALDPDHKHRFGSQRACIHDDAASAVSADAVVGALVQRTRPQTRRGGPP